MSAVTKNYTKIAYFIEKKRDNSAYSIFRDAELRSLWYLTLLGAVNRFALKSLWPLQ